MKCVKYCPVCRESIRASNFDDVEEGLSDSYIFVHYDIPHEKSDIDAFNRGIN